MTHARVEWKADILKSTVRLPSSKSLSNRALIIQKISGKNIQINNLSEAGDTRILQECLNSGSKEKNVSDAGTVMRFLTAYYACTESDVILKGSERMHERPIGILVDALKESGAEISYLEKEGFPPIHIKGKKLKGGKIKIDAGVSSQFLSAILLVAPYFENDLILELNSNPVSSSYIRMTLSLMKYFGVEAEINGSAILIKKQQYQDGIYDVEADWSSASYWYEMLAISGKGEINFPGLNLNSMQGDQIIADIMEKFGVRSIQNENSITAVSETDPEKEFNYDFISCPDLLPACAVTCAGLGLPAMLIGLEALKIKESDRIAAISNELSELGSNIRSGHSFIQLFYGEISGGKKIHTYNDHRIALSFAPLAILGYPVDIENPDVVKKSYPTFWNDLKNAGFSVRFVE